MGGPGTGLRVEQGRAPRWAAGVQRRRRASRAAGFRGPIGVVFQVDARACCRCCSGNCSHNCSHNRYCLYHGNFTVVDSCSGWRIRATSLRGAGPGGPFGLTAFPRGPVPGAGPPGLVVEIRRPAGGDRGPWRWVGLVGPGCCAGRPGPGAPGGRALGCTAGAGGILHGSDGRRAGHGGRHRPDASARQDGVAHDTDRVPGPQDGAGLGAGPLRRGACRRHRGHRDDQRRSSSLEGTPGWKPEGSHCAWIGGIGRFHIIFWRSSDLRPWSPASGRVLVWGQRGCLGSRDPYRELGCRQIYGKTLPELDFIYRRYTC